MIHSINNVIPGRLPDSSAFDLIVVGAGYETRSRHLVESKLARFTTPPGGKVSLELQTSDSSRAGQGNRDTIRDAGFRPVNAETFDRREAYSLLQRALSENKSSYSILIDYSAMKRPLYAALISAMSHFAQSNQIEIQATFSYSVGRYASQIKPKIVSDYVLLPGFQGSGHQVKPKHCIYSLGYESILISSLHEWIEPSSQDFIVANPGAFQGSAKTCMHKNKEFIGRLQGQLYQYDLRDVAGLTGLISEKAKYRSVDADVMFVGLGPKPFVLAGLLAGLNNRNLSNVYAMGQVAEEVDVVPSGEIVVSEVVFVPSARTE